MTQEVDFIAEVSANHLGSIERAKQIVLKASEAGATSVKFQTYTADTMTLDLKSFSVSDDHPLWGGMRLHALYKTAYTPWEWHGELFSYAKSLGIVPFSSPFDITAVDFLESLNIEKYKIASLETGDLRLINAVAETGKPIIMSTGATELTEIAEAVEVIRKKGNKDLTLLVCTSSYPASPQDSHINRIMTLRKEFNCKVGLSDHTLGIGASIAAVALGATAIEKHLTIRREDGGPDSAFSMEPEEFSSLVREGKVARESLGESKWEMQSSERESRRLRRSLYIVEKVSKGQIVSHKNVRAIRPGGGGAPRILDAILGLSFNADYEPGTPMSLDLVEK
jgi:N-acetylneuraminate synthase